MPDFLRVRFRTEMPIPPEEEVEYTLNEGGTGSERKEIPAPPDPEVEVLPGPGTDNRTDPDTVELYMRQTGSSVWFMHRYRAEPGPVHVLEWTQSPNMRDSPVAFQGFREEGDTANPQLVPIPGTVEPAVERPDAPPPSP